MSRANTSSVDSNSGYKLAHLSSQQKAESHEHKSTGEEQVVNARKNTNLASAKAKAKKRAKLAKASKKKNKK
ncbi:MAG: hypothetical protein U9R50_01400 [Campylobacterota bacterium]|nr:hypothetical protein [Campylobacterota bacterium]